MKQKWKSIKDTFIRHRRKEKEYRSGAVASVPSRYIHADQLEFLIPCVETRSTDSSWERQEDNNEEEDTATQDPQPCTSIDMSETQPSPSPSQTETEAPTTSVPRSATPAMTPPVRRRTILRGRRQRNQRDDRLINVMEDMAHNVQKMSCEAHFLLSLEDKMKRVSRSQQTEARDAVTRALDSFLPPEERSSQQQPTLATTQTPLHTTHLHTHPPPPNTYYPQTPMHHPPETWHSHTHSPFRYPTPSCGRREEMQGDEHHY